MSKITNDGLTLSGTGCFVAVPIWQQWWATKGFNNFAFTVTFRHKAADFSLVTISAN